MVTTHTIRPVARRIETPTVVFERESHRETQSVLVERSIPEGGNAGRHTPVEPIGATETGSH